MTQYPNTNKQTVKLIESGGLGNKQHKKKDEFVKSNHAQQRINTMLCNYKMGGSGTEREETNTTKEESNTGGRGECQHTAEGALRVPEVHRLM